MSKLAKCIEDVLLRKSPEVNFITFSQFKKIFITVAEDYFICKKPHKNTLESFIKRIKSWCKVKYNVEVVESIRENTESRASLSSRRTRKTVNPISKCNSKVKSEDLSQENSEKKIKKSFSTVGVKKVHKKIIKKIFTSVGKTSDQGCLSDTRKKRYGNLKLDIIPISYRQTPSPIPVITSIKEKFGSFKNIIKSIYKSNGKCHKRMKNNTKYVLENRQNLVSSSIVAKIVFNAWKNYTNNR